MDSSDRVAAADAFFLHVESPAAVQQVGGLVLLDARVGPPTAATVTAVLRERLGGLPRFRQRLRPRSRWQRPGWADAPELDWSWHVQGWELPRRPDGGPGGVPALSRLVAELQAAPLPRDRPLWRLVVVPEVDRDLAAAVLVVHHVVADGVGLIRQALRLLDPLPAVDPAGQPRPARRPATAAAAAAVAVGIGIAQLATDQLTARGRVRRGLPGGRRPPAAAAPPRYGIADVPLPRLRELARRHHARVTDVLLGAVAGGLHRLLPELAGGPDRWLRTLVPLLARDPGTSAAGNLTAAVMIDLPLGRMPEPERLARIARRSRRLHTGTRAAASRFVIQVVGQALPPPLHAWFARSLYGGRLFQAIVSNLPGPDTALRLAGWPLRGAYPVVPLAPGSPLAVGALGWHGTLRLGITADPALLGDPATLGTAVGEVLDELAGI